jgi:hypothetical protein
MPAENFHLSSLDVVELYQKFVLKMNIMRIKKWLSAM